jgi:hypothetical protein
MACRARASETLGDVNVALRSASATCGAECISLRWRRHSLTNVVLDIHPKCDSP